MPQAKEKRIYVDKKREEAKPRTEWCAAASKCRCMRCGRGSKHMKLQGTCTGPKILGNNFGNMEKATYGRTRYGQKNGLAGRSFDLVQKMVGLCTTENGTKNDELLQAGASGHKRAWKNVVTNSDP